MEELSTKTALRIGFSILSVAAIIALLIPVAIANHTAPLPDDVVDEPVISGNPFQITTGTINGVGYTLGYFESDQGQCVYLQFTATHSGSGEACDVGSPPTISEPLAVMVSTTYDPGATFIYGPTVSSATSVTVTMSGGSQTSATLYSQIGHKWYLAKVSGASSVTQVSAQNQQGGTIATIDL